jgi:Ca-activated chloride channel family protein
MSRIAPTLLVCLLGCSASLAAHAGTWSDLWLTREQQAQRLLDSHHAAAAASMFSDPRRQAYADLEAGQYAKAAGLLAPFKDADSQYNRGNALAHTGKLRDALQAYDAALAASPGNKDVIRNRDLVKRALEEQERAQQPQQNGNKGQSGQGQQRSGGGNQGGQADRGGATQNSGGATSEQQSANASGSGDQRRANEAAQAGNQPRSGDQAHSGTQPPSGQAGSQSQAGQAQSGAPQSRAQSSAAAQAGNPSATGAQPPTPSQSGTAGSGQTGGSGQDNSNQPNPSSGNPATSALARAQRPNTPPNNASRDGAVAAGGNQTSGGADATTAREDAAAGVRYQQSQQGKTPSPANRLGLVDSRPAVREESNKVPQQPPTEQSLALDQWLRSIPEDSGELLQRKFLIEHMMRQRDTEP